MPRLACLATVLLLGAIPAASMAQSANLRYTIEVLQSYTPSYAIPNALNNRGDYVMSRWTEFGPTYSSVHFVDRQNDRMSVIADLNDRGEAVGWKLIDNEWPFDQYYPMLYSNGQTAVLTDGSTYFHPIGMNNTGQVTGMFGPLGGYGSGAAYVWDRATNTYTAIGTLGGSYAMPYDINDHGMVVGASGTADGGSEAFVWRDGTTTSLGLGDYSWAVQVNNAGQILAVSRVPVRDTLYLISGDKVINLSEADPGFGNTSPSLNNAGQVLTTGGLLWQEGHVYDVRQLIDNSTRFDEFGPFVDINDQGEILASACVSDPFMRWDCAAIKLVPVLAVPEPATWAMLVAGLGLVGLGGVRRQRRRT